MKIKTKLTVVEVGEIDDNDGKPGALVRLKVHPANLRALAKLLYNETDAEIEVEAKP